MKAGSFLQKESSYRYEAAIHLSSPSCSSRLLPLLIGARRRDRRTIASADHASEDQAQRAFKQALDVDDELGSLGAVDHPMVG
jgi:hypothetical protein